ncbi:SGNH/GDSL hydrolase family protein [Ruegeria sp. EL01]|jgi:lysophospholipase L1-like esterase|uniref:SGNH/GDSL hydrolase family protein n=1 Tax=Ruegeria sp. EL01 TaxID=2107578 RepID=UPI000EA82D50|nr:SGNH/GDSL hydrolase family protein [Ruegeria sp. EL01]
MPKKLIHLVGLLSCLLGCQEAPSSQPNAKIIAVGDSLMAWNSTSGSSIPDVVEKNIGSAVIDRTVSAAWLQTQFDTDGHPETGVQAQFVEGDWKWAIVNGGGNDLMLGCGCARCDAVLDRMISADGQSGQIPQFLRRIRDGGTQVIYVGYLRSPKLLTPIEHCKAEGDEFEARIARLAQQEQGITFVSNHDVARAGDASYFSFDLIHPSRKSSRIIGERVAKVIKTKGL